MIIVNARFLTQYVTGVQRFAIELCKRLPEKINGLDVVFVTPKQELKSSLGSNVDLLSFGNFSGQLWEQIDLPIFLKKNGNPLLINLVGLGPIFYDNKIIALYDLAFKHHPEWFSFKFQFFYNWLIPISIKNSKLILTDSNYVKADILNSYKVDQAEVEVIYADVSDKFKFRNIEKEKIILTVSSIEPRKNLISIMQAFKRLSTDYKLLIVGSKNKVFSSQNFNIREFENENIEFTGYIDDDQLVNFYNKSDIFIYASFFEGFGIPPLEAQACGCPCIVSNVTSLPEIYKDSVVYCDPYSVDDIKMKLESLMSDKEKKMDIIEKGFENVRKYSWEKSSIQLVSLINQLNFKDSNS